MCRVKEFNEIFYSHLLKSGFVPNYICCTKHGESRIIMDEGEEEEEELDHADIIA